jgi:hypothetical protein
VTVEKPEVCEGEENLVTVKAHTPNGDDANLHYLVGTQMGPMVPLRLPRDPLAWPQIVVFGRTQSASIPVPAYRIRSCPDSAKLLVEPHLRPNRWGEYDFEARIVSPSTARKPFVPVRYRWSFGDGATGATTVPLAAHNYEMRSQETLFSSYLIEVEANDDQGQKVVGRASLSLDNPAFETLRDKHFVQLLFSINPRYPELSSDGTVRQSVRAWHARGDHTVEITKVTRVRHKLDGTDERRDEDPSLLGSSSIPSMPGIEGSVALDLRGDSETFSVDYSMEGTTDDGLPAYGKFSIMRPLPRPTREANRPVRDPVLLAKIRAARRILGQDYVSDEDILRLDREGKLTDLDVTPLPAPTSTSDTPPLPSRPAASPRAVPSPAPADDPRSMASR